MQYVSNPVFVEAFQITGITTAPIDGSFFVNFMPEADGSQHAMVEVTKEQAIKFCPSVGDYYVVPEAGAPYLCPKDVFEAKFATDNGKDAPKSALVSKSKSDKAAPEVNKV